MATQTDQKSGQTSVRHGDRDVFLNFLKEQGYKVTLREGSREDLKALEPADRSYGQLHANCKILLVDAGKEKGIATRYWHITFA